MMSGLTATEEVGGGQLWPP